MHLEYRISEGDFMAAYEAFWRSRKLGSKAELIWGAIAMALGVAFLLSAHRIGWAVVATGAALATLVPLRYVLHRRAYRESPAFAGPTAVTFSDDIIEVVNPIGESQLKWSLYQSALESEDYFLPMVSKRSFSIIPKRSFASEAEIDSFRTLLEAKLGEVTKI